ncbi:MAG: ABC transporter permease [Lachnospiraceae bacterium]|nr:ABC transporter permease [Lachnospiraceae bacterium]
MKPSNTTRTHHKSKAFQTMLKTECKLSIRGMDMVIFALCLPALILVLLGIIYGNKPAYDGSSYTFLEQSFGALCTISICAGGVMGLPLLVSDYRHKKILKRFQVTPASPLLILAVHVAIYALYAILSLISLTLIGVLFFGCRFPGSLPGFLVSYLLVMLSMFSIGIMVGGLAPDLKTASILASVLYFPMLIFSGATLPYEVMPQPLQKAVSLLPLTQGIKLLKATSLGLPMTNILPPVLIMLLLTAVCITLSLKFFRWE